MCTPSETNVEINVIDHMWYVQLSSYVTGCLGMLMKTKTVKNRF